MSDDRNLFFDLKDADADAPRIITILDQSMTFIDHWRRKDRGVLIHCTAGMSRSATLVFLYLYRTKEVQSQLEFKKMYPMWFPNMGFQALFRKLHIE